MLDSLIIAEPECEIDVHERGTVDESKEKDAKQGPGIRPVLAKNSLTGVFCQRWRRLTHASLTPVMRIE